MNNEVINAFKEIGFTEEEASEQLVKLFSLIEANLHLQIIGPESINLSKLERSQKFEEKIKDDVYRDLASTIFNDSVNNYVEVITQNLTQEKKDKFINSIRNYAETGK